MLGRAEKEMLFLNTSLANAGFNVVFQRFGSTATGKDCIKSDIDVAVIVPSTEKTRAVAHLRQLGGSPERSMNWAIDVFDCLDHNFGYNSRAPGTLHLLVISQQEYNRDTPLAVNVRATKKE